MIKVAKKEIAAASDPGKGANTLAKEPEEPKELKKPEEPEDLSRADGEQEEPLEADEDAATGNPVDLAEDHAKAEQELAAALKDQADALKEAACKEKAETEAKNEAEANVKQAEKDLTETV